MKKQLLLSVIISVLALVVFAQRPHKVVFYNLENLFDTINDPRVLDDEFTPTGAKRWDGEKYVHKLANTARVFSDIAALDNIFPAVIGVVEVENRAVLEDLVAMPKLAAAGYNIAHYDSPEERGVDVAFLYRPDVFSLTGSCAVHAIVPQLPNFRTRDILTMWGEIDREPFFFMVVHLPSRRGGSEASEFKRVAVAEQMRRLADSVMHTNPAVRVVAMGDFNDDPIDRSMTEALNAKLRTEELAKGDLYNPFGELLKAGRGTLAYGGAWNLFDQIVVSQNLVDAPVGALRLINASDTKYFGNIFCPSYLIQQEGRFKGYPLRTYSGNNFQGGFSDHLPVFIYLGR